MNRKINNLILISIYLLSIVGIVWNVYSYLCIGLIHQYDIYGFNLTPERMEILDTMWMSFIVSNIINSLLLLISILQKLILKHINIRQWFYSTSLMVSTISLLFWENRYGKLLMGLTEGCDVMIMTTILKPGYITYFVGIMIITILLSLLEKCRMR